MGSFLHSVIGFKEFVTRCLVPVLLSVFGAQRLFLDYLLVFQSAYDEPSLWVRGRQESNVFVA